MHPCLKKYFWYFILIKIVIMFLDQEPFSTCLKAHNFFFFWLIRLMPFLRLLFSREKNVFWREGVELFFISLIIWKIQYAEKNNYRNFTRINFYKLPNSTWCIRTVNITEDGWEVYGPRVEKIMETRKYGAMATDVSRSTVFYKVS